MNRIISCIFFIALIGCNSRNKHDNVINQNIAQTTFKNAFLSPRLLKMTKIFMDSLKCKECLQEVFIDMIYEDSMIVTIKGRDWPVDYFAKNHPLFLYYFSGKPIFVYSGLEEMISSDMESVKNKFKKSSINLNYYLRLSFTVNQDSFYLNQISNLPFGLPLKIGKTPYIDIDKFKGK